MKDLPLSASEIFGRIVPGGVYLFAFLEFARVLGWLNIDWASLADLGILHSLGLTILAYVVGTAMDRIVYAWSFLFNPGTSLRVLDEFKEEHKNLKLDFDIRDWAVLRAYIHIRNPNLGDEIDKSNAISIMFRNLSFGLIILAASQIIQFVNTRNWLLWILIIALFLFSYQLGIQASEMRAWFYRGIFETIVAYRLKLDELVKPVSSSTTLKKGRAKDQDG